MGVTKCSSKAVVVLLLLLFASLVVNNSIFLHSENILPVVLLEKIPVLGIKSCKPVKSRTRSAQQKWAPQGTWGVLSPTAVAGTTCATVPTVVSCSDATMGCMDNSLPPAKQKSVIF